VLTSSKRNWGLDGEFKFLSFSVQFHISSFTATSISNLNGALSSFGGLGTKNTSISTSLISSNDNNVFDQLISSDWWSVIFKMNDAIVT
jgi:hypothetical protein